MNNKNEIFEGTSPLWTMVNQYKLLFNYYIEHKNSKIRDIKEIKDRIEYLKNNPEIKQMSEIATLRWVLNEIDYDVEE